MRTQLRKTREVFIGCQILGTKQNKFWCSILENMVTLEGGGCDTPLTVKDKKKSKLVSHK